MKILHINNYDTLGGASKACFAINNALRAQGIDSEILTQSKLSKSEFVNEFSNTLFKKTTRFFRIGLDLAAIKLFTHPEMGRFSFPYLGVDISKHPKVIEADILHFHWINGGFFSLDTFQKLKNQNKKIVWTFHDMWAFTGGCHYTGGCNKFKTECKFCPYLKKSSEIDLSNKIFNQKKALFNNFDIRIVTCSNWLANETKTSALLKDKTITAIPNPIDINTFSPFDKIEVRKQLNLNQNKKYILFGTMTLADKRKGLFYLLESLRRLGNILDFPKDDIEVLIFGSSKNTDELNLPFKTTSFGRIADTKLLAKIYSAADVFIAPSLEDNLPNTVMESLSCGTPVAAFDIGGMSDMIIHKQNGYLAKPESVESLTEGIVWILSDEQRLLELNNKARNKVITSFTNDIVANMYINVYKDILR